MKKTLILIMMTAMLLLSACIAQVASAELGTAIVNNPNPQDRLNLRTKPSTEAISLGKYYTGTEVTLMSSESNGWYKVKIGSLEGYMQSGYLTIAGSAQVVSAQPVVTISNTGETGLNLRSAQSASSASYGLYSNGTQVTVLGISETWAHVQIDGQIGFMLLSGLTPRLQFGSTEVISENVPGIAYVHNPNPQDRLNLRTRPNGDAPSLGKYYNGTSVTLLSSENNGWYKVKIGTLEGYMQSQYLNLNGTLTSAQPVVTVSNKEGTGLNLRSEQSTSSASLGLYKNGTQVVVLGLSESWCHVVVDGKTGFMLLSGLSPRLQFDLTESESGNLSGNSSGSTSGNMGGSWNGPVGVHRTTEWPLKINDYLAAVNNPNPADRLNLRSAPTENAASLGKYYNGVRVIIEGDISSEWTPVSIGNLHGYMKTEYLVTDVNDAPVSAMPVLIVNNPNAAKNLNLREKQSTSSKSLGIYPNGTEVILMGFTGEWAHVIVGDQMGFMQAKYLK